MQTTLLKLFPEKEALIKPMPPILPVERVKRMVLMENGSLHLYRDDAIIRCLAESNYCSIYYETGMRVILAKTIKAIGELLPGSVFIRVHRSHIIRRDAIEYMQPDHIVLNNGEVVPVSRRYKPKVKRQLAAVSH